ncbi:hypothetical protein ICHIJ1_14640 [Fluviibacter phosphoraccumulans]|uniref:helix-turn-helix domain-containing protein n=1 Tax=Fluviibacter phosphoraccumulans TaxID=1751046 RepID=UPI001366E8C5|nr:helix-turn-helix domain-containing protein [Fluviibacter phosphoraccumulans]BBU71545.1 hypothetical protein ICHIJ1_14640 [Fluviibacter phosphoraccumulans]
MGLKPPEHTGAYLLQLEHIDQTRLAQVWKDMTGGTVPMPDFNQVIQTLSDPTAQVAGTPVAEICRHFASLVEALDGQKALLIQTGVEALKYRLIVALMNAEASLSFPKHNDTRAESHSPQEARSLEQLCNYIKHHLNHRFNVETLETLSGLSARTLQYQFKKRFGCSPMKWITQQRLNACRNRFLVASDQDSVTAIALAYGFTNLGNFARAYGQQFGELPSETLEKMRR